MTAPRKNRWELKALLAMFGVPRGRKRPKKDKGRKQGRRSP